MPRSLFLISFILASISMASCQKSSTTASPNRGDVGGGGTTSEGEIEHEVSGMIANEEPVEFVQSMDSVEISGVNLASSTQYQVKAFYLSPLGKKIQIHESVFSSNRFNFKAKVPKHLIIIEAVRISDGGKFAGLLPPPMRKLLAKLRMNRTTSIAAKMAGIIGDNASSGGAAAQAALTTNSISVADVLMVAQSVRLAVDEQKNQNVGSSIDLNGPALKLLEKSNERLSALIAEGQKPETVAEKLSEKTYATVFGDKAEEISPAILAHRTNHHLGSSAAATTDVAYETIKSLSTPAAKQLDEAFRVEAEAYRKAADLTIAVAAESTVSSVYAPKFTACKNGEPSCAATAYVPPIPPLFLLGAVSVPTASIAIGIYTTAQSVILSSVTTDATIYYTLDGSAPTTASMRYSNPIGVLVSQTIKAIAVKPNFSDSAVGIFPYTITGTVQSPTFSVAEGSYGPAQGVTLNSATPGATIYYTTNGTTPTTSSTQYSGAITVSTSQTIKAFAVLANWTDSSESSAIYTINGAVATPTFSVPAGAYGPAQSLTLSTS
ncbi:MAG: chitobiase/beta-hexosaminidase C-terminal domain-containing protein, partial [bacterium]